MKVDTLETEKSIFLRKIAVLLKLAKIKRDFKFPLKSQNLVFSLSVLRTRK